ncbi:MAG TPA: YezD family protein [Armatimonadota bacterium]|nr:YezD family protein [Armatimonadota bacterium]
MGDKLGANPAPAPPATVPLEAIQEAVKSVRYGVVQLIIQDGRVVQIDKTEKIHLA